VFSLLLYYINARSPVLMIIRGFLIKSAGDSGHPFNRVLLSYSLLDYATDCYCSGARIPYALL
jgi:hypothetical protein